MIEMNGKNQSKIITHLLQHMKLQNGKEWQLFLYLGKTFMNVGKDQMKVDHHALLDCVVEKQFSKMIQPQ